MSASTTIEFNTSTYGFGITPTIGVGGGFLALDMNVAWTDVPQLSKPARSFIFGPRLGKNFKIKKPKQQNHCRMGRRIQGAYQLRDQWIYQPVRSIAGGCSEAKWTREFKKWAMLNSKWMHGGRVFHLSQQQNPVNEAKYNAANRVLARAGEILASADNAINTIGTSTVQYSMDKRPKDAWNFIVGSQYQLNKHWMLRGEYGFLGSRTQFLVGVQYRFGL